MLFSFSLIKLDSSKGVYAVHPLIHAVGRDRMSTEDKQRYSLMAYGMLAGCLLADFDEQPYQFRRILVTHLRANTQHSVMAKKGIVERYFDDAHENLGDCCGNRGIMVRQRSFKFNYWMQEAELWEKNTHIQSQL